MSGRYVLRYIRLGTSPWRDVHSDTGRLITVPLTIETKYLGFRGIPFPDNLIDDR